jgi:hypothetical protein
VPGMPVFLPPVDSSSNLHTDHMNIAHSYYSDIGLAQLHRWKDQRSSEYASESPSMTPQIHFIAFHHFNWIQSNRVKYRWLRIDKSGLAQGEYLMKRTFCAVIPTSSNLAQNHLCRATCLHLWPQAAKEPCFAAMQLKYTSQ